MSVDDKQNPIYGPGDLQRKIVAVNTGLSDSIITALHVFIMSYLLALSL